MATIKSTQITNNEASPVTQNPPNVAGKLYRVFFDAISLASGNIGDVIEAVKLPKGARVLGGYVSWEAMSGGTQTLAIGIAGDTGKWYAATAMGTSEGDLEFGKKISLDGGVELTAAATVLLTNGTAAWSASKTFKGWIDYLHN